MGFARRFAPYKRADLVFRDAQRLKKILCDEDRPVQVRSVHKNMQVRISGWLVFYDLQRLKGILCDEDRPLRYTWHCYVHILLDLYAPKDEFCVVAMCEHNGGRLGSQPFTMGVACRATGRESG